MSGQRVEYMAMYLAEVGTLAVCCMIAFSLIRKLCFLHFLRFALVAFFEFVSSTIVHVITLLSQTSRHRLIMRPKV